MKKISVLGLVLLSFLVSACNTMEGMGEDLQKGGEKIEKESREHKNY